MRMFSLFKYSSERYKLNVFVAGTLFSLASAEREVFGIMVQSFMIIRLSNLWHDAPCHWMFDECLGCPCTKNVEGIKILKSCLKQMNIAQFEKILMISNHH